MNGTRAGSFQLFRTPTVCYVAPPLDEHLRLRHVHAGATGRGRVRELKAELTPVPAPPAISDEQVAGLQARLERLHAAKELADEELYALEDIVADYVELKVSMPGQIITEQMVIALPHHSPASKLHKLIGLSAAMVGDHAFARQARRKYL